jgi:hypothetical protein
VWVTVRQLADRFSLLILALAVALSVSVALNPAGGAGPYGHNKSLRTDVQLVVANDISCTPVEVAAFKERVHVKCAAAVGGILYFAAPTSDVAHAARILSLISTAQVAGRTLGIKYDPADTKGSSFGCGKSDCRTIIAVSFGQ